MSTSASHADARKVLSDESPKTRTGNDKNTFIGENTMFMAANRENGAYIEKRTTLHYSQIVNCLFVEESKLSDSRFCCFARLDRVVAIKSRLCGRMPDGTCAVLSRCIFVNCIGDVNDAERVTAYNSALLSLSDREIVRSDSKHTKIVNLYLTLHEGQSAGLSGDAKASYDSWTVRHVESQ